MRETLRKLHQSGKKGFTLAELLIVIAITGILVSFGFVEITKYQRKLKRLEMDNTAREIFVAAQNHLTASKTSGVWQTAYYKDSKVSINTSNEWQQSISATALKDDSISSTEKHDYYYVIYNSSSYQDALTSQKSVLGQLLPFGSVDETVRTDGSYIIVFDAYTESVYGVFYTDKGTITQADLTGLIDNEDNEEAREAYTLSADAKKKYAVGYYGGAVAFKNQTKQLQSPIVHIYNDGVDADDKDSNLAINKNTLEVVIQDPNWTTSNQTTVKITVKQLSTTLSDPPEAVFSIAYDSKLGKYTVSSGSSGVYDDAMNNAIIKVDTSATGITYHLCFDDITNRNTHFNDLFKEITPGSDISVMASIMNPSDASVALVSSAKIGNSLFASVNTVDKTSGTYEAVVSTGRHLANLSQRVSGYASKNGFTLTSASLKNDIDWAAYAANALTPNGKNIVTTNNGGGDKEYDLSDQKFLALENDTLTNFDGNGFTLSNFDISTAKEKNSGLFGNVGTKIKAFTAEDIDLVNFNVSSTGKGDAGTFLGNANKQITLTNIHSYCASTQDHTSAEEYELRKVSSSSSAGGLVGEIASTATITNCSASVKVQGDTGAAGGLIGSITAGTSTIEQSYVGGKVKDKYHYDVSSAEASNISGGTAGGFIGIIKNRETEVDVTDSYSTASVYGINKGYAGGFLGVDESKYNLSLSYVYSTGSVGMADNVTAGSFIGKTNYKISWIDSVGILNKVSNFNDIQPIGKGGVVNGRKIIEYDYDELIQKAARESTGNSQANPYNSSVVDSTYPYPATKSSTSELNLHYGDFPEEPKAVITLTKNIHIDGNASEADRNLIIANIHFDLYDTNQFNPDYSTFQYNLIDYNSNNLTKVDSYTFTPDDCKTQIKDGFACQIDIDADVGSNYVIIESSSNSEKEALQNRFEKLSDSNYFNTTYEASFRFLPYFYNLHFSDYPISVASYSLDANLNPTKSIPINTRSQTTAVTYDSYYQPKKSADSGLIYYERYADGSYQTHGYSVKMTSDTNGNITSSEVETGNSNFTVATGFSVAESGYLFTINKTVKDTIHDTSKIRLVLMNWADSSLQDLMTTPSVSHPVVSDVTAEMSQKLGIADQYIYRINFDDSSIDWSSVWTGALWKQKNLSLTVKMPQYTLNKQTYNSTSYTYHIEPRFADSIRKSSDSVAPYVVRTAEQLKVIMDHTNEDTGNSTDVLSSYGTITQAIDIDMSKYSVGTISSIYNGLSYQGTDFINADGSHTYPLLSGLKNTFIKHTIAGANIKNLRVSISIDGKTSLHDIQKATTNNQNYGAFISDMEGNLENIIFENVTMSNITFGSESDYLNAIGIIGSDNTSVTLKNVQFKNCDINEIKAYTNNFSLLGKFTSSANGLIFDNVAIHDSIIKTNPNGTDTSNVGLLSSVVWQKRVDNMQIYNVKLYNITSDADNTAIIGSVSGTIHNITVQDTYIYNDTENGKADSHIISGGTCGLIGNIDGNGSVDQLLISKDKTKDNTTGFTMENLYLNTRYWGAIGCNNGRITDSDLNYVNISSINSSNAVTLLNRQEEMAYGVIGKNGGYNNSFDNFGMNNIVIQNITVPASTAEHPVYVGIIGSNEDGMIDNYGVISSERTINNISIHDIYYQYDSQTVAETNQYAWIGYSEGNRGLARKLTITNYNSAGYGFIYSNQGQSIISSIAIGTKEYPTVCIKQYFACKNSGTIRDVNAFISNSSKLCESNSGTANGTLNGTPVSN
ncbi:MAG: type II secretion system GspH family protein [Solobacterium sp.]|jgi:prepilin-type N-terminal cleavage/methylation domain-containing protein|nr:type II secretion system GspH family protein [Solobacterium sp.]MCH4204848.1 type II secretion system GspH family protein [Solobacterium sp.]MCH4226472.1 type II secretion system GspH family protein [Solobacterium sp.]MCH4283036.1 type II secretion system GspH family protein [Solobacterium sp.]